MNLEEHSWFGNLGKRRRLLLIATILFAVSVAPLMFEVLIYSHMYPQDAVHDNSNLAVRGIVTAVETNRKSDGLGFNSYHIFRFYIHLKITEIVWAEDWLTEYNAVSYANDTVNGWSSVVIGYDNLDNPRLAVGQNVECRGYYVPVTDIPYSFKITVAQSINGSYLKPQT